MKPHLSRRRFANLGRLGAEHLFGVAVATPNKCSVKPAQDWQIRQDLGVRFHNGCSIGKIPDLVMLVRVQPRAHIKTLNR